MRFFDQVLTTGRALRTLSEFILIKKKWVLAPLFLLLFIFASMLVLVEGSALAPLIYTLL